MFSWSQARFYLSGWYGVGSALEELLANDPAAFAALQEATAHWAPLRYLITNVSTSVLTADPDVMRAYAALVDDDALLERLLGGPLRQWRDAQRAGAETDELLTGCCSRSTPSPAACARPAERRSRRRSTAAAWITAGGRPLEPR